MKLPALTIRKWLILAWLAYAFLPAAGIGIAYGVLRLITTRDPSHDATLWPIVVAAGAVIQFGVPVVVGVFMGRAVLRPLAAMSQASRQIAAGDLSFDLPPSNVREVAQVSAAFSAMGDGLRSALRRQAQLEEERRFFISAIAHDLRTPLFSLRGYLEGLERGVASTPEKAERYVKVCQEKADELERLVADLFAYTRVEHLDQAPACAPLDLADVVRKTAEGMRPLAEAKSITLVLDGRDGVCEAEGDAHLLGRAIANLLDNALRHTPPGGTIWLRWQPEPEGCRLSVADSGPGIDPRDLPRLFEPLYRGEVSRSRQTGGAGLGLAIARRILQAHGGELTAANRASGGAEFTGTLTRRSGPPMSLASSRDDSPFTERAPEAQPTVAR